MNSPLPPGDEVRRFIVENRPVRGHWVRLEGAWRELRAHKEYPEAVRELLGQAVAASVLLAATLKFNGTLTLQLQGNGAVKLLVAQCTHDFRLRAVANFAAAEVEGVTSESQGGSVFRRLVGTEGRVIVTIESQDKGARYQGIVPLSGASLADSLESYFASSEQLPTRVVLAADSERGVGMLVQKLPTPANADESDMKAVWEAAQRGVDRLSTTDLLLRPLEELLARGFGAHDMRLFTGTPVKFECRCNEGRVSSLLRALGEGEVRDVLKEQGAVTVTCEFCHRPYRFDAVDVDALFADGAGGVGRPPSIH
ncbi:MAG: Hsp33 family molecular chaperone HslO [Steroidobacteraceae bacterium]